MRIFLIGFMGSGKSAVGKKLANKLNLDFLDLDILIEDKYKMTIPSLFQQFGEKQFRNLETITLKENIQQSSFIMSCGGGTPCFNSNMDIINNRGTSVYINLDAKTLANRIYNSRKNRPLVHNISKENLPEKITELLQSREKYYKQAKITINGFNLDINSLVEIVKDSN